MLPEPSGRMPGYPGRWRDIQAKDLDVPAEFFRRAVSPGGVAAPFFCVVDGETSGHAYAVETENGTKRYVPLAAHLPEGSVVTRRRPPEFHKTIFDAYATHSGVFSAGYFPDENKLLAVDGAKVRLSAPGLIQLLKNKVTVLVEPSKLSHLIQALDTPTVCGRFQPAARRCIRERVSDCVETGRRFDFLDLMNCAKKAAGTTFTPSNVSSAFQRVGMWPLDPSRVSAESLSRGAAQPVLDVDLAFMKARLIPVMRKDLCVPVVSNGTLSATGRPVVLTAPEVVAALPAFDEEREQKAEAQRKNRQLREKRAAELKAQRDAKILAAEQVRACKAWIKFCEDVVQEAQSW